MKYFLALVPPPYLAEQIEEFRAAWGPAKTAPHITVKAPNSLSESSHWLPQVNELCQRVAPFEVTLAGIGQFGTSVLYLRVVSAGVVALHHALLRIVNPPPTEQTAYSEGTAYLPHLTLAHTETGITEMELAASVPFASSRWAQPITFIANALVVYRALASGSPYEIYQTIPLTGRESLLPIASRDST